MPAGFRLFLLTLATAMALAMPAFAQARDAEPMRIKVVGGLGSLNQYTRHEAPFWTQRVPELTGGALQAEIAPFDRSGIRGQEMLQLMRLGVVPFGTVLLGLAASEEPELNALDLPLLSPDLAALRRSAALLQPQVAALLAERYDLELLGIYVYPAQVVFCLSGFASLADLAGRRIRTSTVAQSELMAGLGAIPVQTAFNELVGALRAGVVECAITGTLSGNTIGLHEVTTHLSPVAIAWGTGVFAANRTAWEALPEPVRAALRRGISQLQESIWDAADRETADGLACNAGRADCQGGRVGRMSIVSSSTEDEARRRRLLAEIVVPGWVRRCGQSCAQSWNRYMAPSTGITAGGE